MDNGSAVRNGTPPYKEDLRRLSRPYPCVPSGHWHSLCGKRLPGPLPSVRQPQRPTRIKNRARKKVAVPAARVLTLAVHLRTKHDPLAGLRIAILEATYPGPTTWIGEINEKSRPAVSCNVSTRGLHHRACAHTPHTRSRGEPASARPCFSARPDSCSDRDAVWKHPSVGTTRKEHDLCLSRLYRKQLLRRRTGMRKRHQLSLTAKVPV